MLGENATTRTVLRGSAICCALHFVVGAAGPFRWCWYCTHRTQGAVPLQLHHTCEISTCHFLLVSCLNTKSGGMLEPHSVTRNSQSSLLCLYAAYMVIVRFSGAASLVTFRPQLSPISVLVQFCKLLSGSVEIRYCELKIPFEPKCRVSIN